MNSPKVLVSTQLSSPVNFSSPSESPMNPSSPPTLQSSQTSSGIIAPPAPKTLLIGGTGTGKTYSLRTTLDTSPDARLFILFTEPGMEVLADTDPARVHWHYVPPLAPDWKALISMAMDMNLKSQKALLETTDPNKNQYQGFVDVLRTMADFTCDRCGQHFGPVDKFGPSDFLAIDSLSGLNVMALALVSGAKPIRSPSDWGMAMSLIQNFVTRSTSLWCPLIVTGHLERELDEASGQVLLMASTLGKKLAPTLPRFFSDVILSKRDGTKFSWSTAAFNVDLKARNLSLGENLEPSFVPLITAWRNRQKGGSPA